MLTISTNTRIYAMHRENAPAAVAKSGETVCFETLDCYGGQIVREGQSLAGMDWSNINPATGPLYVEGARAGDVLKVEILKIEVAPQGVMLDGPNSGVTGRAVDSRSIKIFPVADGNICFNEKLTFPAKPMIGVIGTAPAGEAVPTDTPAAHGGNMDCATIREGAVLYLPVHVDGALLAMGDLHASMGDGEVAICGVEIGGRVTVRVTAMENCGLPTPFLISGGKAAAIYSGETLDDACVGATMAMHRFLTEGLGMNAHEAGMMLSVAGDLRICQIVDPAKTCRMEIPLWVAEAYSQRYKAYLGVEKP